MKKYKLDRLYSQFLTRVIVCSGLFPFGYLLHGFWKNYIKYDIKNYIIELLVHFLGYISDFIIIILTFLTLPYAILFVVKTIKQIKKENSNNLLKNSKFILSLIFMLIAGAFSIYSFSILFDVGELAYWYYL